MLVIAPENNRELKKVRKLLAILGQSYQILFTNLETDLGLGEDSLASLLTYTDPSSREGSPSFLMTYLFLIIGSHGLWGLRPIFLMVRNEEEI